MSKKFYDGYADDELVTTLVDKYRVLDRYNAEDMDTRDLIDAYVELKAQLAANITFVDYSTEDLINELNTIDETLDDLGLEDDSITYDEEDY